MHSYRVEVQASMAVALPDTDAEVDPVPTSGGGRKPEPGLDRLSNIIQAFNDQFGNVDWKDGDKIRKVITEELPAKVSADKAFQNAVRNSDRQNTRIERDAALQRAMNDLVADHVELSKMFQYDPSFRKFPTDNIFAATYRPEKGAGSGASTP